MNAIKKPLMDFSLSGQIPFLIFRKLPNMKRLLTALILSGCVSNRAGSINSPVPINQYDEEVLRGNAESLNMEYSDYLNALKNGKISELRSRPVFYQAHDPKWNDPSINPVFDTRAEAEKYAKENNMDDHHSYKVREVDYRYEVRIVNSSTNEILHTTNKYTGYGYIYLFIRGEERIVAVPNFRPNLRV